jgi:PAS domain S-box
MDSCSPDARGQNVESFLRAVLDDTVQVVYIFDAEGRPRWWNQAARERSGRSDADLESMSATAGFETLVVAEDRERAATAIDRLVERGSLTVQLSLRADNGESVPFEFRGSTAPVADETAYMLLGYDISDRVERDRKVEQPPKLYAQSDADDDLFGVRERCSDGLQRDYRGAVERRVLPRY